MDALCTPIRESGGCQDNGKLYVPSLCANDNDVLRVRLQVQYSSVPTLRAREMYESVFDLVSSTTLDLTLGPISSTPSVAIEMS